MSIDLKEDRAAQERLADDYDGNVPIKLTKEELRELSELNQLRSTPHIVAEWAAIIGAIYLCQHHFNIFLYLLTVAFIGARQHALLILMHDGVHYRLFRNRRLNDWTAEIVLAWPNLISARAYRKNHISHHRYLNTPQDPDWVRHEGDPAWAFPQHWSKLAMLMLRDLSGFGATYYLRLALMLLRRDTGVGRGFLIARYSFYVAVVGVLAWFGAIHVLLMYWFVPLFTWMMVIFRIRSIAEHSAIEGSANSYAQTRSTRASILERVFVAPKNVNYHIEHHFYPSVPFYRLPKLHRVLMSKAEFKDGVHITRSYLGVLRESVRGAGPANGRLWEVLRIQPSRAQG